MPRLPAVLLLATLAGACAAPGTPAPRTAQAACVFGEADLVPLQGRSGMVVAGAMNDQPMRIEVSTGIGYTAVLTAVAQRLDLPTDPRRQTNVAGLGTQRNVTLRSLQVGREVWSDRSLTVRPHFSADGNATYDAMLAANLLREVELEIDLPARRVGLHMRRDCQGGGPAQRADWTIQASAPVDLGTLGVPVVTLRVNGQPVRAAIHSGANMSTMSRRLAERLGVLQSPPRARMRAHGAGPTPALGEQYLLREVALDGEVLRDLPVVVTADAGGVEELALGEDWLALRKVWISYPGRRIFLARP